MKGKVHSIFLLKYMFMAVLTAVMVCSCEDDPLVKNSDLGSGEVEASFAVSFEPSAEALTRATAGDAIKDINWLAIVIYDDQNHLHDVLTYDASSLEQAPVIRDPNLPNAGILPTDYNADELSESSTPRVAPIFKPTIPIGRYHMYAVANVDQATKDTIINNIQNRISTPAGLKRMVATWNKNNIASNSQMFGYFTQGTNGESVGFDAPEVEVSRASTQFHAWVKRCASKVTIVYDGSQLHEDVYVYIHKVTIHDIPKKCYLGQENKPKRDTDESKSDLWKDGESIYYNTAGQQLATDPAPSMSQYESWMRITKGSGLKGAIEVVDEDTIKHSEKATALYFYENAQGKYNVTPEDSTYYKPQRWKYVGKNVYEGMEDFKDNVVDGTYIEVEAYYVSKHAPGISQGKIKYRFMLGQDTHSDYNAFRNRHYKLTLKFKGYANQADWHIEYVEDIPEIYTPDAFYVSYLYNKKATFPMRIIGNCTALEVEIIRNDWWPYDPDSNDEAPAQRQTNSDEIFEWHRDVWANAGNTGTANGGYRYGKHTVSYSYDGKTDTTLVETPPYVGFLSLTVPTAFESTSKTLPVNLYGISGKHWYSYATSMDSLKAYYEGNSPSGSAVNTVSQCKRTLSISTDGNKGNGRNAYTVTTVSDGSKLIELPMWTRPFSMILISGFSGNNPYEAYQRKALLRIRGKFKLADGSTKNIKKTVPVYQVRRIFNPKGVWRRYDNNDDFKVRLMQRRNASVSNFSPFESEGPWRAEITARGSKDFCYLDGKKKDGDAVVGETGEPIEFDVKFHKNTTASESNCAVITVYYHSLNCEHVIFVRQGYDNPLEIVSKQGKWSSYSLYAGYNSNSTATTTSLTKPATAAGVFTKSPLALGSFFKRGNYDDALITSNNVDYPKGVRPGTKTFALRRSNSDGTSVSTRTAKKWGNILGIPHTGGSAAISNYQWANFKVKVGNNTRTYSLPTMAQYTALQNSADVGFGVLYADGATTTATTFSGAYGYLDPTNNGHRDTTGMRGVIVYNRTNANQVFFPVGYSGVGRRTIQNTTASDYNSTVDYNGVLRYGSVGKYLSVAQNPVNEYRPICYNLPNNAGAIYWAKNALSNGNLAWDMNLADQNFAPYDYACSWGNRSGEGGAYGDALPIKLVLSE